MDKFNKDHYVFSYPELSRRFQFELSYPLLQALLVGNLPFPRKPDQPIYRVVGPNRLVLRQSDRHMVIDNYLGEESGRVESLRVVQPATQNTLSLEYEDFKNLDGYLFPFTSRIMLDASPAPDQPRVLTEIGLSHSKVELLKNNPGFPFSIPSNYKKR